MSFKEYLVERYGIIKADVCESLFRTPSKDDADKELEPGTNVHCYENGEYTGKKDPPKRKISWQ